MKKQYFSLSLTCSVFLLWLFNSYILADEQENNRGRQLTLVELLDTVNQDALKTTTLALASKAERATLRFDWPSTPFQSIQVDSKKEINALVEYVLLNGLVVSQEIYVLSCPPKLLQKVMLQLEKEGECTQKGAVTDETVFVISKEQNKTIEVYITPETDGGWVAEFRRSAKMRKPKSNGINKKKTNNDCFEVLGVPILLGRKANEIAKFLERHKWSPYSIILKKARIYVNDKHVVFDNLSFSPSWKNPDTAKIESFGLERMSEKSGEAQPAYQEILEKVQSRCIPGSTSLRKKDGTEGSFRLQLKGLLRGSTPKRSYKASLIWYHSPIDSIFALYVEPKKIDDNKAQPSTLPAAMLSDVPNKVQQGWPAKGTTMCGGKNRLLNWLPASIVEYQNVELQFSDDNGKTWATVATKLKPGQVVMWTVPNITSKTCLLRIAGLDAEGKCIPLETSDSFKVGTSNPFDMDTEE